MRTVLQTLLAAVLFLTIFSASAFAGEKAKGKEENRNIVFALDDSGSMRITDKNGLSKLAAEMFIKLMDGSDNLAVLSFSSDASVIVPGEKLADDKTKLRVAQKTNSLSRSGRLTNIESAMRKSLPLFPEKAAASQALLLLTDGKIDLDNNGKIDEIEKESRKRILGEVLQEYKRRQIPVYSIAFGNDSDEALLRSIALESGGLYFKLDSAEQITKVYFTIFNQYKAPQLAFVQEGVFTIDKAVSEATLLVQGDMRDKELVLRSPSDREFSNMSPSADARWAINTGYTMITLIKPEVGEWSLRGIEDDEAKIILITNIKLNAPFRRVNYFQDEPIFVLASIDAADLPEDIKIDMRIFAELMNSEGAVMRSIELFNNGADDGICVENMIDRWYGGYYAGVFRITPPLEEGLYVIRVRATTHTFNRERQYSIRIHKGNWITLESKDLNAEKGQTIKLNAEFNAAPFWACNEEKKAVPPCEVQMSSPIAFSLKSPSGEVHGIQYARNSASEYEITLPDLKTDGEYTLVADMVQSAESMTCFGLRRDMPFHFKLTRPATQGAFGGEDSESPEETAHGFGSLRAIIILAVAVLIGIIAAAFIMSRERSRKKAIMNEDRSGAEEESEEEGGSLLERRSRRKSSRREADEGGAAYARKVGSSATTDARPKEELDKIKLRNEGHSAIDELLGELTKKAGISEASDPVKSKAPRADGDSKSPKKDMASKEEDSEEEGETGKDGKKKYKTAREMSSLDKAISRLERKAKVLQQKAPEEEEPNK